MSNDDHMMTLADVAEYLALSERTVRRLIEEDHLPAARIGGVWRVSRRRLEAWINDRATRR